MKNLIWIPIFLLLISFGCEDSIKDQSVDLDQIEELEKEIISLSQSIPCTNSTEWKFTPMGSKACGGPVKYIAYHQSVEERFLELVNQYTLKQEQYNLLNKITSDCALVSPPRNIICEGGKPFLVN